MTEEEFKEEMDFIDKRYGNLTAVAQSVARSLVRLVAAQEKLVELAMVDLSEQVEAGVEGRAQERATEILEENKKRGFIGKK